MVTYFIMPDNFQNSGSFSRIHYVDNN